MAKQKTRFVCKECGHTEPKWSGRCPSCGEWNTYHEMAEQKSTVTRSAGASVPLESVAESASMRTASGIGEVDRVLGGGIMRGAAILVGGEPGIGKSTLMMQIAAKAGAESGNGVSSSAGAKALYVSGEESAEQLRSRAARLGVLDRGIEVLCESSLETILGTLDVLNPILVIIDSIQTISSEEVGPVPGTVNQIKFATHALMEWSRSHSASLFLVAHVTKEGAISGPKVVEHMVDTVLYFDQSDSDLRILRSVKNRFGSVDEIGLFTMRASGLEEVGRPDLLFLHHRSGSIPAGVVVVPVFEGTRILLVELQALVVPAKGSISRVFADRIDSGRVSRVAAVIEKHLDLRFSDQDIYVNVAGGIRVQEVGIELPLALALYSARTSIPLTAGTAAAGELTLAGEIRPIRQMASRAKAVRELSFSRLIGPAPTEEQERATWNRADTIAAAVAVAFGKQNR